MKRILCACLLVATLAGCATQIGPTKFPTASVGFVPQSEISVPADTLWDACISALDEERILIASMDKASGRIITDYIPGATHMYVGGLGGSANSRYKYNIVVRSVGTGSKLSVVCKIESSYSGSGGNIPFRDVGAEAPELVAKLEAWLYEKIERKAVSSTASAAK